MRSRRATLPSMDLQRMVADVCDLIDAQGGGGWDAVVAGFDERWPDEDELAMALTLAYFEVYREPGGPAMIRQMRDSRRPLVPAASGRRWGWRATG